jgi:2-C-methyl-D-erythritol 4-phosphate cytidylyltransferase
MKHAEPKQYLELAGRPLLAHTCEALLAHPAVETLVLVVAADDERWRDAIGEWAERIVTVTGGRERCHSVYNGLRAIRDRAAADDWALVHDAARPCLSQADLHTLLERVADDPVGGLLGLEVRDTMKRTDAQGRIVETVDRTSLWHALTPQVFRFGLLYQALEKALEAEEWVTDEASAMERRGHKPLMVQGSADNLKVTRPEDLALAEWYLTRQKR